LQVETYSRAHSRFTTLLFFSGALLIPVVGCHRPPSPDVAATVNGKDIPKSDLEKYYKNRVAEAPQEPSGEQASIVKLGILRDLIDEEITQQNAAKLNLTASDEDVNAKITEIKIHYSQEEFDKHLKEMGITLDDFKRDIRRSLVHAKLFNREVDSKINITDAEIEGYYNAHKSEFNFIEPMYHLARIVATSTPSQQAANLQGNKAISDADAKKKIQALHAQLEGGQEFGALAMSFSEDPNSSSNGGDMGFIPESQLRQVPVVFDTVSKLKVDQNSDVVTIPEGNGPVHRNVYMVFRLLGREVAGQRQLNDPNVQQKIRQQLREAKGQLLREAYIEKVRNDAKVHNYFADQILKQGAQ